MAGRRTGWVSEMAATRWSMVDGRHLVVRVAGRDGTAWVSHQAWKSARPVPLAARRRSLIPLADGEEDETRGRGCALAPSPADSSVPLEGRQRRCGTLGRLEVP